METEWHKHTHFLCCFSLHLPITGVFPKRSSTSERVTLLVRSIVVMVTRQEAVTRQQCLCPQATHAVLTTGEQNITYCTPVWHEEAKGIREKED